MRGVLANVPPFGQVVTRPTPTAAWTDTVGSGTWSHLPEASRAVLSLDYPLIADYSKWVVDEAASWAALRIIVHRPGPVPPELLIEASRALELLAQKNRLNGQNAVQILSDLMARGIRPSYAPLVLDRPGPRAKVVADIRGRTICRPIDQLDRN